MSIQNMLNPNFGIYSIYIWPCYILFVLIISWHMIAALRKHKAIIKEIALSWQQETKHD